MSLSVSFLIKFFAREDSSISRDWTTRLHLSYKKGKSFVRCDRFCRETFEIPFTFSSKQEVKRLEVYISTACKKVECLFWRERNSIYILHVALPLYYRLFDSTDYSADYSTDKTDKHEMFSSNREVDFACNFGSWICEFDFKETDFVLGQDWDKNEEAFCTKAKEPTETWKKFDEKSLVFFKARKIPVEHCTNMLILFCLVIESVET